MWLKEEKKSRSAVLDDVMEDFIINTHAKDESENDKDTSSMSKNWYIFSFKFILLMFFFSDASFGNH